ITAQLFGANPAVMADAAKMVEDLGFDAVDINLGCPAKKVVKCGGSGLLRHMPLLEEIFQGGRGAGENAPSNKICGGGGGDPISARPGVRVGVASVAEEGAAQ